MLSLCSPIRRQLIAGSTAWHRGELDRAISILEAAASLQPTSPDPLLPLARARSEAGDLQGALADIDRAIERLPGSPAGPLYRGLILFDHGRLDEAAGQWEPLRAGNHLASALAQLIPLERTTGLPPSIQLPPWARWFAEIAGRLAGTLETRYFAARPGEALSFHHAFRATETPRTPLEQAFARERFAEVEQLAARIAGPDEDEQMQLAHALLALGKDAEAARCLAASVAQEPSSAVRHFVHGVAHARFGRTREARWCFVRAARLRDYLFDGFLGDLLEKLGIQLVAGTS
jgi:tetratricopeptide (TPR) repeat protein